MHGVERRDPIPLHESNGWRKFRGAPPPGGRAPNRVTEIMRTLVTALALLLVLGACATPGTKITDQEIQAAQAAGTLEALFARVQAEIAAEGQKPAPRSLAVKAQVGALLAEARSAEVEALLEASRLPSGRVPLGVLGQAHRDSSEIELWDPSRFARIEGRIDEEERATRSALQDLDAKLAASAEEAYADRVALLGELVELAGDDPAAAPYAARRDQLMATLTRSVDEAIQKEEYDDAQRMLRIARELDPQNPTLGGQIVQVDTKLTEKRFWKRLEDGDPDGAYQILREISKNENFEAVRARLAPSADPMADYFVSLAADTTAKGNLPDAYRWFSRARSIREILGQSPGPVRPEEAPFIDAVKKRYWEARKGGQPGLAWAYLSVVERLEPTSPSLKRMLRETREEVVNVAVKQLTALPFENSSRGPDFGEAVSSKVIQHLFETIPQDLRIIERKELSQVLREKELGKTGQHLASADYIIQGDILEAKVDTNEKKGRKTVRVVTEQVSEQNPAYLVWLEKSEKERKNLPEPPQQITVDHREDVSVDVTVHRKVGIFSVSYRVIDAQSAKVIFADSQRGKQEHEDTSTEGVELGNFKMEFKLASLPSDGEILAQLADEVSEKIGVRLAEVLANPEDGYASSGARYVDEGNFARASEQYAYAFVLAERKGKDVEELGEMLRDAAMRSIERGGVVSQR